MGDPAGVGPEIAVKALAEPGVYDICRPLVVGDSGVISQAVKITGIDASVEPVVGVTDAKFNHGTIDVLDLKNVDLNSLQTGQISAMAGNAAFEAISKVIELALEGQIDATVTGPIHKEALNLAGHHYAGHTEIYAHLTGTKDYTMMLAAENIRVVHVSTHVSLRQACDLVKKDRILSVIRLAVQACRQLDIEQPRIGVAGLNPHSSDGGLFGSEEREEIIPAIQAAKAAGINADGPVPADTLFSKARGGWYDIVVAMYHDQGHIPLKLLGFIWNQAQKRWTSVSGINITLGLPIIRTSVDHGTAIDQAGKGTAIADSLIHAIEYAAKMATNRAQR
ncbi:MAG: 4-hydroxythreonine-4-phosphate dehydrogenase PdxA [Planctomycetota bacterium]